MVTLDQFMNSRGGRSSAHDSDDDSDEEVPEAALVDLEAFWGPELQKARAFQIAMRRRLRTLRLEAGLLKNILQGPILAKSAHLPEFEAVLTSRLDLNELDCHTYDKLYADSWTKTLRAQLVDKFVVAEKKNPEMGWCQTLLMVKVKARNCVEALRVDLKMEYEVMEEEYLSFAVETAFLH
jgi:hypothetical protein